MRRLFLLLAALGCCATSFNDNLTAGGYVRPGGYPTASLPTTCSNFSMLGDTTTGEPKVCQSNVWVPFGASGGVTTSSPVQGSGSATSPVTFVSSGCSTGEFWRWSGSAWSCDPISASPPIYGSGTAGSPLVLSVPGCMENQVLKWDDFLSVWGCEDDTDTNTTYTAKAARGLLLTGTAFGLLESCSHGQLLKWDSGASGEWVCSDDTNTTYSAKASGGLALDTTEFRLMTCATGKVLKSTGAGTWDCSDDTDTNTTYTAGDGLTLTVTDFDCDVAGSAAMGCVTTLAQSFGGAKTFEGGVLSTGYSSATSASYGATTTTTVTSGTNTTVTAAVNLEMASGTGSLTLDSNDGTLYIDKDTDHIRWVASSSTLDIDLRDADGAEDNVLQVNNSGTGAAKLGVKSGITVPLAGAYITSTYAGSCDGPEGGWVGIVAWSCKGYDETTGLTAVVATAVASCSGDLEATADDVLIVTCHAYAGGVHVKICNHSGGTVTPSGTVYIRTFGS